MALVPKVVPISSPLLIWQQLLMEATKLASLAPFYQLLLQPSKVFFVIEWLDISRSKEVEPFPIYQPVLLNKPASIPKIMSGQWPNLITSVRDKIPGIRVVPSFLFYHIKYQNFSG